MKKLLPGILFTMGMGSLVYMMYKENPDMVDDMKKGIKDTKEKISNKIEKIS